MTTAAPEEKLFLEDAVLANQLFVKFHDRLGALIDVDRGIWRNLFGELVHGIYDQVRAPTECFFDQLVYLVSAVLTSANLELLKSMVRKHGPILDMTCKPDAVELWSRLNRGQIKSFLEQHFYLFPEKTTVSVFSTTECRWEQYPEKRVTGDQMFWRQVKVAYNTNAAQLLVHLLRKWHGKALYGSLLLTSAVAKIWMVVFALSKRTLTQDEEKSLMVLCCHCPSNVLCVLQNATGPPENLPAHSQKILNAVSPEVVAPSVEGALEVVRAIVRFATALAEAKRARKAEAGSSTSDAAALPADDVPSSSRNKKRKPDDSAVPTVPKQQRVEADSDPSNESGDGAGSPTPP